MFSIRRILLLGALFLGLRGLLAQSLKDVIQFSADKYSTNVITKRTVVEGNVYLKVGDREVFAEKLSVDFESGEVECEGSIRYRQGLLEIEARGLKFNLRTGLGVFYSAAVKRAGAFQLEGLEIKRESENIFVAKVAKISFCQDCPQAWSLVGDRVRVNTERYAEIHHAVLEIKDLPILYLPVVYYPVQDRRFTGFLIPYFRFSTALGAQAGIPFFWALSDNVDLTWDYRYMSRGGHYNGLRTRMKYSEYSFWDSSSSWIRTPADSPWFKNRYGIHYGGRAQLSKNWAFFARGDFISDKQISENFEDSFSDSRFPSLSQDFFLNGQTENLSGYAGLRFTQDNINRIDTSKSTTSWTLPEARIGTPFLSLFSNTLLGSLRLEQLSIRRFEHRGSPTILGKDPYGNYIASGDRFSGLLDLSLPLNFDVVRSATRFGYRGDYYKFTKNVDPDSAARSHLHFQQSLETDFSRVYDRDSSSSPKLKHIVTPFVEYSFSPPDMRTRHDFLRSCVGTSCPEQDPRFDLYDGGIFDRSINLGTEERERRLRSHNIVQYGFKTQLLGKDSQLQEIRELLYARLSHEYDLYSRETGKLRFTGQSHFSSLTFGSQITWDYERTRFDMLNEIAWNQKRFDVTLYQSLRPDTDNVGGTLRLKRLGRFELFTDQNFDRKIQRLLEQRYLLSYLSPSQCWRFDFGLKRRLGDNDFEYSPSIQVVYSEVLKDRDNLLKVSE